MAEIGLVPFARLVLQIATTVLPRYRTRFSKHQFSQPQLLAILCLMRYEDWTFREAEVRLNEHRELRRALGLHQVPDHSTMCRFLLRLPEESIGRALADAEFDSEKNHTFVRRQLKALSVIPAKRGKKTWRVRGVRAQMRRAFPQRLYRRRALVESVFSAAKRKLSARAPGRTLLTQVRQALVLGLAFNLYRLKHPYWHTRISTERMDLLSTWSGHRVRVFGPSSPASSGTARRWSSVPERLTNTMAPIDQEISVDAPGRLLMLRPETRRAMCEPVLERHRNLRSRRGTTY
jgi:transposase-like protein DUF772/DDE family transposase